ncbi:MAG: hypothetical protein ACOX6Y_09990 [Christensenellales bacterium]|jgi:hypothetical protein
MGFLSGLITTGLIGAGIHVLRKGYKEAKQAKEEEEQRRNTPCFFSDGISEEEFEQLVRKSAKRIKRVEDVSIDGTYVYVTVRTQSGVGTWNFSLDFNDYGHITGTYWRKSDNHDSKIPEALGNMIQEAL